MKLNSPNILTAFALTFALVGVVASQTPVSTPPEMVIEDDEVINIDSRLVIVPVSITDGNGVPVKGLGPENFTIRENKKLQDIEEVTDADKVPLEIALLFDISGTTEPMFEFEQQTAVQFLQDVMRTGDHATIFTIGETPLLAQERNVVNISTATVRSLAPTKSQTAFFDTVSAAADYLRRNAPAKSRKVVITISDGEDNASQGIMRGNSLAYRDVSANLNRLTPKSLTEKLAKRRNDSRIAEQSKTLKKLQDGDTVFYSINPAGSSYKLNKISVSGQQNMQRFADETGGSAFLPKFLPIDLKSNYERASNIRQNTETLNAIFSRLKNELQAQYLVQYYSSNDLAPDSYVDIDLNVNVRLPQGINVRSRKGYFVK